MIRKQDLIDSHDRLLTACRAWVEWIDSDGRGDETPLEFEDKIIADMRAAVAAAPVK